MLVFLSGCTFNEMFGPFEMTTLSIDDGTAVYETDDAGFVDFQDTTYYAWNRVYTGGGAFTTILDPPIQTTTVTSNSVEEDAPINMEYAGVSITLYAEVYDQEGRLLLTSGEGMAVLLTPL